MKVWSVLSTRTYLLNDSQRKKILNHDFFIFLTNISKIKDLKIGVFVIIKTIVQPERV